MAKDGWDIADISSRIVIALFALAVTGFLTWYGIHINSEINDKEHNYRVYFDNQNREMKAREFKYQEQLSQQQKQYKELEISQKYIEIAVSILNTEPSKGNDPLRDWAIDIIKKYAPIPLTPATIKALKTKPLSNATVNLTGASSKGETGTLTAIGTHVENEPKTNRTNATVNLTGAVSKGVANTLH